MPPLAGGLACGWHGDQLANFVNPSPSKCQTGELRGNGAGDFQEEDH